jgi:cytochrome c553
MSVRRPSARRRQAALGVLCLLSASVAAAGAPEPDLANGEEINEVCAGCHGDSGQGGKQGEYPRLAGQPEAFLVRQLELFRERERPNMAMVEYVDHRQMPDADIADISAFLAAIELPTRMPPVDPNAPGYDALERLQQAERVMQIPPAPGDVAAGGRLYRKECASCHGRQGQGDRAKAVPMLSGQYTNYLWRQVDKYLAGVRIPDPEAPDDRLLAEFERDELRDIFAYAATLDD